MSRNQFGGPKLPKTILDQVQSGRVAKGRGRDQLSRKDQRKADRRNKHSARTHVVKTSRSAPQQHFGRLPNRKSSGSAIEFNDESRNEGFDEDRDDEDGDEDVRPGANQVTTTKNPPAPRSILKSSTSSVPVLTDRQVGNASRALEPKVSKTAQARLDQDDAEIAALEKKLGIKPKKGKRKSALEDDFDWILEGSDEGESGDESGVDKPSKRKRREDEDWLRSKRLKAQERDHRATTNDGQGDLDSDSESASSANEKSSDFGDESDEDFAGFDDEELSKEITAPRVRENPYVAPVSQAAEAPSGKYIPPSLRASAASSDEETLRQLRRQLQGLLNRLSETNIASILGSIEQIYAENARQHVTSTLIDLLITRICDAAALNDTFLILHAGFAAAVFRSIGTDFGAQLLEATVLSFDKWHKHSEHDNGKHALNLIAFLSNLYILQAVGCEIVFDYVRMLLDDFTEQNTELLLRIIRISGTQLRQDDPSSLKDIVLLLQRAITKTGEANLSVRTKVMVETIHNLKNNRMKTGLTASALAAEHTQRMRKTLGTFKSRSSKVAEPLRITLSDIRDTEKKGKWWLVGASYHDPAKMAGSKTDASAHNTASEESQPRNDHQLANIDDESKDTVNLDAVARAQGMNTDVRRAIFISIMGALDYHHARVRINKLNLRAKQQLEIPRVILHCVGAEPAYNHFYTLVATLFAGEHRLRKAFEFSLMDILRRMGEIDADGDADDSHDASSESSSELTVRAIYNLAKCFSTLVAQGLLRITILRSLNWADLQAKTKIFVEVFFVGILTQLHRAARKGGSDEFQRTTAELFSHAHSIPQMIAGLKYYISTTLTHTEVAANKKEKRAVEEGCDYAIETLQKLTQTGNRAGGIGLESDESESS